MRLKVLELDLLWPEKLTFEQIRPWLIEQLRTYGDPLRWAVTALDPPSEDGSRHLKVEAVVITSEQ